jgi:hypothetical protein
MFEIGRVDWINPAENHRMNFLEAGQSLAGRITLLGQRVPNLNFGGRFNIGDEIADVACLQILLR